MTIGERLKKIRGRETQDGFSAKIGVPKNTLRRWERDEQTPSFEALNAILEAYPEINPGWLLSGHGETTRPIKLTESEAHTKLKERLKLVFQGHNQFFNSYRCEHFGLDYDRVISYIYRDYLPSEKEIDLMCDLLHGYSFEYGRPKTRNEQSESLIESAIKNKIETTNFNNIDFVLIKTIIIEIEKIIGRERIVLEPESMAGLIAILYEDCFSIIGEKEDAIRKRLNLLLGITRW